MPGCRLLTTDELNKIFATSFPATCKQSFLRRMYFCTALSTGLRVNEIINLTCGHIVAYASDGTMLRDPVTTNLVPLGYIEVKKSQLKGGSKAGSNVKSRRITPGPEFYREILAYLLQYAAEYGEAPTKSAFLFPSSRGGHIAARTIQDALADVYRAAGLAYAGDGTLSSHSLRKTFADSVYVAAKKDLLLTKEALGHISIDSTLRYINPNRELVTALQLNASSLITPQQAQAQAQTRALEAQAQEATEGLVEMGEL